MAASINDKLRKYKSLFSTTLSTGIGTGTSDTITPATVTGLPTDTAITLTIDRVDASGTPTPSKLERIKGIISGGNLISYVRGIDGTTEQAHTAGAVVEMVWNAADWNDNVDWGLVQHGQDGVHTDALVTSLKATGSVVNTGTSDVTIVTPKALADSDYAKTSDIPTAISKATSLENVTGTDDSKYLTALSNVPAFNNSMARQAIINGNFDVWQRGTTSGTITDTAVVYTADRFYDYNNKDGGTLPTLTRTRELLTPGDIDGTIYFSRLTTNGAGTSLGTSSKSSYSQTIENGVKKLCGNGKKVTVSFYARSSIANKRIGVGVLQYYGTGGSPSSLEYLKGGVFSLTSSWAKYTTTITTNTLVGKTFGSTTEGYLELDIWSMWGTTSGNNCLQTSVTAETFVGSGTIDIAQVQLCAGDVALPFMPKSFEEELRACQRYYEKSDQYIDVPGVANTDGTICKIASSTYDFYDGTVYFSVNKRTLPTMTYYSYSTGASGKIRDFTASSDLTFTNANNSPYKSDHQVTLGGNNTLTANHIYFIKWTADAEL